MNVSFLLRLTLLGLLFNFLLKIVPIQGFLYCTKKSILYFFTFFFFLVMPVKGTKGQRMGEKITKRDFKHGRTDL